VRFVDTSFWIALYLHRDTRHPDAAVLWSADRRPVLTTNHVLGETWTFIRRREHHASAVRFFDHVVRSPRLTRTHVDEQLEDDAWKWLRRHDERPYSFVDTTSFATMRRHRIREALAFDGDFTAAGFIELRL
jgi:uncharacterized protein